ncbi:MAG: 3-hydroxyacyl-CoA dehydrogenase family protein, partial [Roseovarius sp.]
RAALAARAGVAAPVAAAEADLVACIEAAQLLPFEQGMAFEAARRAERLGGAVPVLSLAARRPMHRAGLIEIAPRAHAPEAALAALAGRLGGERRRVIVTSTAEGGVTQALLLALFRAALGMLAAGVAPRDIEAGARALGFGQGPLRMIDEAGPAQVLARARQLYRARGVALRPFRLLSDRLADVTGGDTAALPRALAFHEPAGQALAEDAGLTAWLEEWREDNAEAAQGWPALAPRAALEASFVAEAARLLEAETARHALDVELAAVEACGFDAERGGPLLQAETGGLVTVMRALRRLSGLDPALWAPPPLLDEMVKNGRRFF